MAGVILSQKMCMQCFPGTSEQMTHSPQLLQSGFGYGVGYRAGSGVVPIPTKNYRAERSRVNSALSRELVRAPVACLPPAARLFGNHHFTIVSG